METEKPAQYSPEFVAEMVRRLSGPHSVSAKSLHRETGVSQETLSRWLRNARSLRVVTTREKTPEEKMRLLMAAAVLEGEALGAFLRGEGVQEVELRDWRASMMDALTGNRPPSNSTPESLQIRRLQAELRRKDKALAEVAALVILQKKLRELGLLEAADDSTDDSNEKPS